MQTLIQDFLNPSSDVARFLFVWSWQALLLLAVVYLIVKFFRYRAAAIRYRVWLIGLLGVALLPLCTAFMHSFSFVQTKPTPLNLIVDAPHLVIADAQTQPQPTALTLTNAADAFTLKPLWSVLFVMWAVGFSFAFWRLVRSYWQSRRARLSGHRISLAELDCKDLEAASPLECKLSAAVSSPVLVGLWRSTILLPADILTWTTADERRAILLHEMIHAQRRDQWENFFQALLSAIFYFHPLVRYACKQLSIERAIL